MSTHSNRITRRGNRTEGPATTDSLGEPGAPGDAGLTTDTGTVPATAAPVAGRPDAVPATGPAGRPGVPHTRVSGTWAALTVGMILLIVVLIFILQNLESVRVHFLWVTWTIPLAVDLLLATVLGALIMFSAGSLRMLQLRRLAKRNAKAVDLRRNEPPVR